MKSYVTIEQHICVVCGKPFDTGNILLDRRLKERFEQHTPTDYGLCPEHKSLYEQGYIALVAVDHSKSSTVDNKIKPENAYRTGEIAHIRQKTFENIFNVPSKQPNGKMHAVIFTEPAVIEKLRTMIPSDKSNEAN